MDKAFLKLPRLVQMLLLLIPVVNWVTEIIVRGSSLIRNMSLINLVILICIIIFGLFIGWVDFFWCLLFKRLIFM